MRGVLLITVVSTVVSIVVLSLDTCAASDRPTTAPTTAPAMVADGGTGRDDSRDQPRFADLLWGLSRDEAARRLAAAGAFRHLGQGEIPGAGGVVDYYSGTLFGREVFVGLLHTTEFGLQKVVLSFDVSRDRNVMRLYDDLVVMMVARYGAPKVSRDTFPAPYDRPSRYREAIQSSVVDIVTIWPAKGDLVSGVAVSVDHQLYTQVAYEGPKWAAVVQSAKDRDGFKL